MASMKISSICSGSKVNTHSVNIKKLEIQPDTVNQCNVSDSDMTDDKIYPLSRDMI